MARHDGELKAVQEVGLSEVFAMPDTVIVDEGQRRAAIACYLSASEGWQQALKLIGGAFVPHQRAGEPE